MTPESHSTTGTDDPTLGPPPGCPAHGLGPGGLRRLYGPEAEDLGDLYEKLRAEHGNVAPVLLHDDVPIWVVLGHTENLHMVSNPAQYARDSRLWNAVQDGTVKPDNPLMPLIAWQPICSHAEGDEHLRLRGAVTGAMSTIDFRSLRRHINRATQNLVNQFCERGTADLVSQFAEHLPMAVLCEILGMPEDYNERLVQAARDLLKGTETAIASNEYVMSVLTRHTIRRRAKPEEDFTSHLINHPAGLTDDEVAQHLRLVMLAAYEATANLIANVMRVVLTDPRFRAQLNGGQMTVPQAVEQSLWDEPPFSAVLGYFAKQETELGGQRIRKGDGLLFAIAPGNVDPRVRPDLAANMMGNRSHLAFGGGPHECPGQDIGRAIADVGVDALLMRLPDTELDCDESELRWRSSMSSRHLVELPVQFAPRPRQDVLERTAVHAVPRPRPDWQVTTEPSEPTAPAAPPVSVQPAQAPEPAHRLSAWQRFLRWWRGD
ncbi:MULTISPECIES: cytochrome P450 [Streptomyces]|uniref:Cytochrome P450 n=1 Tax=Streptomyces dengpaensis TaxID=2049881 RepID=A0ABN5I9B9_9ACTN|nr:MULTISPECIES: cytochrome P450 [Streptomyces]AVH59708.1 cytochrome P450 [Streptomyces dengpaensis]PIB09352.1 cytochrome [Streptomyces sp. HG99]